MANGLLCYVVYNMFDKDKVLYVHKPKSEGDVGYKDGSVYPFKGTEAECRQYVIDNQHKQRTPSIYPL